MKPSNTSVLYPGSFDPMHLGHVDVIEQALELFGSVVVAAMHNPSKPSGMFTIEQRLTLIEASVGGLDGVRIVPFSGLAIDAARELQVDFIIKGLRNAGDFEIEQQMAHTNHSVTGVRTVFVPCRPDRVFLSSRFIREIAQYGRDVSHLVPAPVAGELARLFPSAPPSQRVPS
ncbi:MAG TPA: pantetheine-phosphate adenylyltransferase [Ilumatobacteraceae bacterium]